MHEYVLTDHEKFYILPSKDAVLWKGGMVFHHLFTSCSLFFVYEIGHQHIQSFPPVNEPAQGFQNLLICFLIYPVVAVYDFEKYARCISQSRIDSFAMTAIFLMDRAADTGIALFIFICDLSRPVLCGTVIYDQNLHLIPSSEKRTDAVLHISF